MLDSHLRDNDERRDGGGGFVVGLLTGAILGVGLGMLLAPKAGSDLRGDLGEQARNLGAKASETATGLADRGREIVNQAREATSRGAEELRDVIGGGADAVPSPGSSDDDVVSGGSASGDSDSFRS